MSEETSSAAGGPMPSSKAAGEPAGVERELVDLRKEVIESRTLVSKTDDLLESLQAELDLTNRKQDRFERRHLVTSATAFIIVALVSAVGAYTYARAKARAQELDREAEIVVYCHRGGRSAQVGFFLLREPDFGASVVMMGAAAAMLFLGGVGLFRFGLMVLLAVGAVVLLAQTQP